MNGVREKTYLVSQCTSRIHVCTAQLHTTTHSFVLNASWSARFTKHPSIQRSVLTSYWIVSHLAVLDAYGNYNSLILIAPCLYYHRLLLFHSWTGITAVIEVYCVWKRREFDVCMCNFAATVTVPCTHWEVWRTC